MDFELVSVGLPQGLRGFRVLRGFFKIVLIAVHRDREKTTARDK